MDKSRRIGHPSIKKSLNFLGLRPFDVTIKDENGKTILVFKGDVVSKDQSSGRFGGPVKETLHVTSRYRPPVLKFVKQGKQASVRLDGYDEAGAWR
jgi:hypothetical protein